MLAGSLDSAMPLSSNHHEQLSLGKARRIEAASHGCRAGLGTEPSVPLFPGHRDADQEVRATVSTGLPDGTSSSITSPGNRQLALSDASGLRSTHVAADARGNQVVETVVESILVQVINDQALGFPGELLLAPMAWMGSWSDRVIQDGAMLQNLAALAGKGMLGTGQKAIAILRASRICETPTITSARIRTELARVRSPLRGMCFELISTLNTVFNRHSLNLAQGGPSCRAR